MKKGGQIKGEREGEKRKKRKIIYSKEEREVKNDFQYSRLFVTDDTPIKPAPFEFRNFSAALRSRSVRAAFSGGFSRQFPVAKVNGVNRNKTALINGLMKHSFE